MVRPRIDADVLESPGSFAVVDPRGSAAADQALDGVRGEGQSMIGLAFLPKGSDEIC